MSEKVQLNKSEKIAAINWAADEAGVSYGYFVSTHNPNEIDQIYVLYMRHLQEKAERVQKEAKEHKEAIELGHVNEYLEDVSDLDETAAVYDLGQE